MKFPRNAKVFCGQLDAAPFLNVFFLLLVFVLMGSLIYTPGTPLRLTSASRLSEPVKRRLVKIAKSGEITYDGRVYRVDTLEALRAALNHLPRGSALYWSSEPGAPKQLVTTIIQMSTECGLVLQTGDPIQLPPGTRGGGAPGPTKIVAIDLAGQFYFENQIIQEERLKIRLGEAARLQPDLTLVILADRQVELEQLTRVEQIAEAAGIKSVVRATRPRLFGKDTPKTPDEP